jgi:hypothetical protein
VTSHGADTRPLTGRAIAPPSSTPAARRSLPTRMAGGRKSAVPLDSPTGPVIRCCGWPAASVPVAGPLRRDAARMVIECKPRRNSKPWLVAFRSASGACVRLQRYASYHRAYFAALNWAFRASASVESLATGETLAYERD